MLHSVFGALDNGTGEVGGCNPRKVGGQADRSPPRKFQHFHFCLLVKNINFWRWPAWCSCQLITLKLICLNKHSKWLPCVLKFCQRVWIVGHMLKFHSEASPCCVWHQYVPSDIIYSKHCASSGDNSLFKDRNKNMKEFSDYGSGLQCSCKDHGLIDHGLIDQNSRSALDNVFDLTVAMWVFWRNVWNLLTFHGLVRYAVVRGVWGPRTVVRGGGRWGEPPRKFQPHQTSIIGSDWHGALVITLKLI